MTSTTQFECVAQTVRFASRELTRQYEDLLRPERLNAGQFTLLNCLSEMGAGVSVGTLATVLGYEQSTVTRLVSTLSQRGLAEISADPDDRRRRRVTLTGRGRTTLRRAQPLWSTAQERTLARLTESQWQELRSLLRQVVGP